MGEGISRRLNELPVWRYNKKTNTWKQFNKENRGVFVHQLTVVTYNVWCHNDFYDQRYEHIFRTLEFNKVDVICLQEVCKEFVDKLVNEKWIQDFYYVSNVKVDSSMGSTYSSILLSIMPPKSLKRWPLPSNMGRDCLIAEYLINGETFLFGTLHLESLDNEAKRREQLDYTHHQLLRCNSSNVLLLGDFNFDATRNYSYVKIQREELQRGLSVSDLEDDPLSSSSSSLSSPDSSEPLENDTLKSLFHDFKDVWSLCNPNDKGYTVDSVRNPMLRLYERMRYDRVLLRSHNDTWLATAASLIGTEQVHPSKVGGAVVYPSDHFGVIVTLDGKVPGK